MARKELDYVVTDDNRDKGKIYHITEMSASQAEEWATRALLAVAASGVDIGPDVLGSGMLGIARAGVQALSKMRYDDAKPLLAELMTCVRAKPDHNNPNVTRPLVESDIEEVATRVKLRLEVVNLHINFSSAAGLSISGSAAATTTEPGSSNTSTSPPPSEPVFHPAKRARPNLPRR